MKSDINFFSKTDSLRLYVIEHTIQIERLISEAIGGILNIDFENSKSFGFSSAALSFNQKVQIIQDFKGIDNTMRDKLNCLMNIRNKFAHVQDINSFEDLFSKTKNGKNIKKQLEKWYDLDEKKDEDETYKFLFFKLSEEITKLLFYLQIEARVKMTKLNIKEEFNDLYLKLLEKEILKLENGNETIDYLLEKTKKELKKTRLAKK
ncbi:hypothetical protein [Psychroserpens mesophilus]|uniref:hypothetical protein n=1 Tax=Psychroserpens mesophilus TaxID=325473 RepID=UPI003D648D71